MADEDSQTSQNTQAQAAQAAKSVADPVAPAPPVTESVQAPVAQPAHTPVVQPVAPTPVETSAPVVQSADQVTPAKAATPAPAVPAVAPATPTQPAAQAPAKSGGMAGLGLGSLKSAFSQGQSGLSKLTGTLSSVGGNVVGAVSGACTCPEVKAEDWDKKKVTLHKTFYKTFSTRAFGYHFSDAIDKNRGMIEIKVKDYKTPANPMILDTNALFLSTIFIEVEGANPQDKKVVTFDKEFYCKVTKNKSKKDLKADLVALEQEMGKKPTEVYFWFVTCPKCNASKEIRTVIMAA